MPKEWSEADMEKLRRLRQLGANPYRAAVVRRVRGCSMLKRFQASGASPARASAALNEAGSM